MPVNISVNEVLEAIETDKSKVLGISFAGKLISTGDYIPRTDSSATEAQSPPKISFPAASATATYVVVALDLDAPFPSFGVLGPANANGILTSSEPFVANYVGPAPSPGSSPHRYTFFLYEQQADFDGKKHAPPGGKPLPNTRRMRFDLDAWEKTTGLGKPLAVNYFKSKRLPTTLIKP
ncbi:phosphatidylethanolamine-binding protein [Pseudomassariella vexata]|uniref:Phosphatidylethanolamine-binding protein n=1 Tax=Pseudomassariella vexata TaxID=1141098 RepID=A0A1Y2EIM9_9PEZI|nr:phosphatidylethanolamine-binding protein [Pseudomassariella vexata]ORY71449.1 phosphatidylethanolamine-binding protein [Pseudomassariella vexata]